MPIPLCASFHHPPTAHTPTVLQYLFAKVHAHRIDRRRNGERVRVRGGVRLDLGQLGALFVGVCVCVCVCGVEG